MIGFNFPVVCSLSIAQLTTVNLAELHDAKDIVVAVHLNDGESCECILTRENTEALWTAPKQPR